MLPCSITFIPKAEAALVIAGVAPPLLACTHRMSTVDWRSSIGGGDGPAHTHRPSQLLLELHLGSLNVVQYEQHAVFLCQCMQLCSLCLIYAVVFNGLPVSSSVYVNISGAINFAQAMPILFVSVFPVTTQ